MVINVGLLASVLPQFRRFVKTSNIAQLCTSISQFSKVNLLLCVSYFVFLGILHTSGLLQRFVPEYDKAMPFLVVWSIVVSLITYRSWVCQYFIVRMKFDYLLLTGIIATAITLCSMVLGFLATSSYFVIAAAVMLGDVYLIAVFKRKIYIERAYAKQGKN